MLHTENLFFTSRYKLLINIIKRMYDDVLCNVHIHTANSTDIFSTS